MYDLDGNFDGVVDLDVEIPLCQSWCASQERHEETSIRKLERSRKPPLKIKPYPTFSQDER
jgi:hypothetical protein